MNLKPPLRPMSKLFAADVVVPGSPSSETETPQDEALGDTNGLSAAVGAAHAHVSGPSHCIVGPFVPEEIQDSYTRLATLKTQYIKLSGELLEAIQATETTNNCAVVRDDKVVCVCVCVLVQRVYDRGCCCVIG